MTTSETVSLKRQIILALETLPDDASFTDIVECVEFVNAVLEGIADADQGRLIPHEEVMRRVRQWPR